MAGLSPGYQFTDLLIDLGGLTFGAVDSNGVHWHCEKIEGWDSPDVRAEVQQREADHGGWAAPVYLNERVITLAGKAFAPNAAAMDGAIEQLLAAVSLSDTPLTVHETIPKTAMVHRSGKVLAQRLTGTALDWSAQVTAADPRRYAPGTQQGSTGLPSTTGGLAPPLTPPLTIGATTVAGSVTVTNLGSIDTRPVLTITGPVTAPQVLVQMPDATVRFLNYSEALGSGETLTIDLGSHQVLLNGNVSRRRYLTTPLGWPVVPASSAVTFQFRAAAPNPAALLSVQWRSAWI